MVRSPKVSGLACMESGARLGYPPTLAVITILRASVVLTYPEICGCQKDALVVLEHVSPRTTLHALSRRRH